MEVFKLDYNLVRFSHRPEKIFSGLTSNDLEKPKNAFIDNIGRTVTAFYQIKKDDEVYIAMPSKNFERLMSHLEKSIRLTKVKMEKLDHDIYFVLGEMQGEFEFADHIIATKKRMDSCKVEEFNSFRLKNYIPLPGIDFNNEMILNVSEEFVSYTKGCYLGQEVIARVKYLGKPPKKLTVMKGENVTSAVESSGIKRGFGFFGT